MRTGVLFVKTQDSCDVRIGPSAQVLSEFFTTVTRYLPDPMSLEIAEMIVGEFAAMQVIEIDTALIRRAIGVCRRSRISYWDALVVAAAKRARCSRILSEDLDPGQSSDGIIAVNPF